MSMCDDIWSFFFCFFLSLQKKNLTLRLSLVFLFLDLSHEKKKKTLFARQIILLDKTRKEKENKLNFPMYNEINDVHRREYQRLFS